MTFKPFPVYSGYILLALSLVVPLLSSCAVQRHSVVGSSLQPSFTADLVAGLSEQSAQVDSVQGLARFKMTSVENSMIGSQVLLVEKPDRFRVETLSLFGSPLLLLAADGDNLRVLLPSYNRYYTGLATAENLSHFVPIPLKLNDLVSVLLYQPPLINASQQESFALEKGGWLLVRRDATLRQELVFNDERHLVEVAYLENDSLFLQVNYGQFAQAPVRFPHLFEIKLPARETTIRIEFSDLEANGKLRPGVFRIDPPSGVTILSLDEG